MARAGRITCTAVPGVRLQICAMRWTGLRRHTGRLIGCAHRDAHAQPTRFKRTARVATIAAVGVIRLCVSAVSPSIAGAQRLSNAACRGAYTFVAR